MRTFHQLTLGLVFGLISLSAVGCGGGESVGKYGEVVGGPCTEADRCADGSKCLTGGNFPEGLCAVACSSDADCPSGSSCIQDGGNVCLPLCASQADCRETYKCESKGREGASGEAKVCIGQA